MISGAQLKSLTTSMSPTFKNFVYLSIYISKKINKGEKITLKNIRVVRPSFGLHPKYFKKILGKKINKSLDLGDRVKLEYISTDVFFV
jgi:sialic acid synthase SpsE